MNAKGRIGVLIPAINNSLHAELLKGAAEQASLLGYDTVVFTNFTNTQVGESDSQYIAGEENIYQLAMSVKLDGILFAAGRFHNQVLTKRLAEQMLARKLPCLCLEQYITGMSCLHAPQRESFRIITSHMIQVHGCKKLYCLTGPKASFEAQERLLGFRDALREAGLPYRQSQSFFGDFWKDAAKTLGEKLADGALPMPDAVVCANDMMAISLTSTLQAHGIRVPEDVAVTGFDGSLNGIVNDPPITSIAGIDALLGKQAICRLHTMIQEEACAAPDLRALSLELGTSCGCTSQTALPQQLANLSRCRELLSRQNEMQAFYKTANLTADMNAAERLIDLIRTADRCAYLIPGWENLQLCLCNDWAGDPGNASVYRRSGYPSQMRLSLSKRRTGNERDNYLFDTAQLLPELANPHAPQTLVVTPLHHKARVFGYCVTGYTDAAQGCFDNHYAGWCDTFSNALELLRVRMCMQHMENQMHQFSQRDVLSGLYNRNGFLQHAPALWAHAEAGANTAFLLLLTFQSNVATPTSANTEYVSLLLASALQSVCSGDSLCARLGDEVFAVAGLLPPHTTLDDHVEQLVKALEARMRPLQKKSAVSQLPALAPYACMLHDTELHRLESMLQTAEDALQESILASTQEHSDYTEHLQQLRTQIRMMPEQPWSIAQLASSMGLSCSHFQRIYRQHFEVSCLTDVISSRISMAKKLLYSTTLNINEISARCGYQNVSHFMKQFKKVTGQTAMQYRKENC